MAWINGFERKRFDEEQKRLAEEYRIAGMTNEQIEQMYQFDLETFNSRRRFAEHTQQFPECVLDESSDDKSPLFEKYLTQLSIEAEKPFANDRYPGARSMAMKVLYEKESLRLLGAQIVDGDGVDKRIDVLATAIRAKMTALELTELDLSYAPPYSSAKDPVNMAGFMIEDLESGKVRQFHWEDVEDLSRDGSITLLDVRTEGEYRRGHLNGFRNIPLDNLREHLDGLEQDKPVYVNCQTGLRSYLACRLLTQHGFTCAHLSGGYSFYQVVTQERQTARSAYPCGMEKL